MKKQINPFGNYFAISIFAFMVISCDPKVAVSPKVNPDFEMKPPLATDIGVQMLKGNDQGNLLIVANFGETLKKERQHVIQLSSGKVVFNDNGKNGDEKAGDGLFSVIVKEDLDILTEQLKGIEENKDKISQTDPFEFIGRHMVRADFKNLDRFRLDDFIAGNIVVLPKNFLCKLLLDVSPEHSLFITDLGVVEDTARTVNTPCSPSPTTGGAWTFEHLITEMANTASSGISAEDFVKDWLETWLSDATVNSENIPARTELFTDVISPWLVNSGAAAGSFSIDNWKNETLDLSIAPFKLTAIVNRLDLRGNVGYGVSNAGEGRFIFEVLNPTTCSPISGQFNVIFEYGIPINRCSKLQDFGQAWYDLKDLVLGSPEYNEALQEITDVFVSANAAPSKPNGSAINQIRTNERAIGAPWELREFVIDSATNKLMLTTVKQEPAEIYNESADGGHSGTPADIALLVDWVNTNEADILLDKHEIPLNLPTGEPFLGGKSHSEPGKWSGSGITNPEARHHLSLNACSGCHKLETGAPFVHLTTVGFGVESQLSDFLTGDNMPKIDPHGSGIEHHFNDLLNREQRLEELLCNTCIGKIKVFEIASILTFDPIRMEH